MKNKKPNNHILGVIYIIGAAFCFSLMTLFIRLAGDVPSIQKAFFRNAVALVVATVLVFKSGEGFKIKKGSLFPLIMRASFGCAGLVANFWAIDHLVLADANILNKMSPFFAMLVSIIVVREIPSRFEWVCLVFAFVGAALVVKPGDGLFSIPALVGLFSGFGAGTAYAFIRKLGQNGERGPIIVLFFSTFSTLVILPFVILNYSPMTLTQTLLLIMCGCAAAGGQLCITAAYTHAPAKEISVFDYSQVIFAAILGFVFFKELPDFYSILGYIIIILTAVIKWYYGISLSKRDRIDE